jgi:hypothetical protein
MSNTKFTAENTALLLIDHQVGTMKLIKNIPLGEENNGIGKNGKGAEHTSNFYK